MKPIRSIRLQDNFSAIVILFSLLFLVSIFIYTVANDPAVNDSAKPFYYVTSLLIGILLLYIPYFYYKGDQGSLDIYEDFFVFEQKSIIKTKRRRSIRFSEIKAVHQKGSPINPAAPVRDSRGQLYIDCKDMDGNYTDITIELRCLDKMSEKFFLETLVKKIPEHIINP